MSSIVNEGNHKAAIKWFVCLLLFLATTINYMDRSVFSLIEPTLHGVPFMGWNHLADNFHQALFDQHYGNIVISFQIAYGAGLLIAGPLVDRLGTKRGYAISILVWATASLCHSLVTSVSGFMLARIMLGLGEAGNFPSAIKATAEWFPAKQRALATGIFNSGANASYFLAPLIVSHSLSRWGWRSAFLATGWLGIVWLCVWWIFPYDRLKRRSDTVTQQSLAMPIERQRFFPLLGNRRAWAFAAGKGLTDGVWWFYLFYLPLFLNRRYGLDLSAQYWFLVAVYLTSSVGSILGGGLPGLLMSRGLSINASRKLAMLLMAVCVLPIILVPKAGSLFPANPWAATLLLALGAAAHQGWSANLFSTVSDMFPATAVSTVVGFGGAMGALGGALFTTIVKRTFASHESYVFAIAGSVYLCALAVIQLLVPRLGARYYQD